MPEKTIFSNLSKSHVYITAAQSLGHSQLIIAQTYVNGITVNQCKFAQVV